MYNYQKKIVFISLSEVIILKFYIYLYFIINNLTLCICLFSGPGSVVGIETGYWLDGVRGSNPGGRDFPYLSRPALGPNQPPVRCVSGLSRG
jgi:hypothetical protein